MKQSLIETQDALTSDALQISALLRDEDVAEVRATHPLRPLEDCVAESISVSDWVKLAYVEDELICVFGVVKYEHGHNPWMLGTTNLEKYPAAVGRVSKLMISNMRSETKYLFNWVHVKHTKAIKWLKWLGFNVEEHPSVQGPTGEGFCYFDMVI